MNISKGKQALKRIDRMKNQQSTNQNQKELTSKINSQVKNGSYSSKTSKRVRSKNKIK